VHEKELFEKQAKERGERIVEIVSSKAQRKVVVSGPGTGKTFLFKEILKGKTGDCLALTFINNLADKLADELGGRAKCCTFHKYCKGLLHSLACDGISTRFFFYPKLILLIRSDAHLSGRDFDFKHCFRRLERSSDALRFFLQHADYYDAVAFDDSVYRVMSHFEKTPSDIPAYEQVVVDEYQDFNLLEMSFLDLLASKSNILIVGDDDQALYGQLKDANPEFIRQKYNDGVFAPFQLPFCNRCTEVIVGAVNDVVDYAKRFTMLQGRIDKEYICFLPGKENDNKKHPHIAQVYCSTQTKKIPYISRFIEQQIRRIPPEEVLAINEKADFTVLVTGPKHYLEQVHHYFQGSKEFIVCIDYKKQDASQSSVNLKEGFEILLANQNSNLGWRILSECDTVNGFDAIVREAVSGGKPLKEVLPEKFINKHNGILSLLTRLKAGDKLISREKEIIEKTFDCEIEAISQWLETLSSKEEVIIEPRDKSKVSIILTTYVGCKGLSAGHVFALGLNEGILPVRNSNPSDIEICQFIVILTRATEKCYLISAGRFSGQPAGRPAVFLNWIDKRRLSRIVVDKDYWPKFPV